MASEQPTYAELVIRLERLERARLTLDQLPLQALKRKLAQLSDPASELDGDVSGTPDAVVVEQASGDFAMGADATVAGWLVARSGLGGQVIVGEQATVPSILFGSDVNLYNPSSNVLQTDDSFYALQGVFRPGTAAVVEVGNIAGAAGVKFGSTTLYQSSAGVLTTTAIIEASSLTAGTLRSTGPLFIDSGASNDQILFRNSAGTEHGRFDTAGDLSLVNDLIVNQITFRTAANAVVLDGELTGALGAFTNSIKIIVDGVAYKIPFYA